jgi:hypothetical protein
MNLLKSGLLRSIVFFTFLNITTSQAKRNECGGQLIADSDSVDFPGEGETILPGEVCVWTVHLNSTRDFRLNFKRFNIAASNSRCTEAGVRIYSISNLVPSDRIESYT